MCTVVGLEGTFTAFASSRLSKIKVQWNTLVMIAIVIGYALTFAGRAGT
jgi:hypothetical protein